MTIRSFSAVIAVVCAILISVTVLPSASASVQRTSPYFAQTATPDNDGDGVPDDLDEDDDNDGYGDDLDDDPLDPNVPVPQGGVVDPPVDPNPNGNTGGSQNPAPAPVIGPDFDKDGIPDEVDPDDDNDGVVDDHDWDRFNPAIQNPPADPDNPDGTANQGKPLDPNIGNDPTKDSDGDGIADDLDPDDNNNGVVDREEPLTPDKTPTVEPTTPGTKAPGKDEVASSGSTGANPSTGNPVVTSLPKTGSGGSAALPSLAIVAIAGMGLLALRVRSTDSPER